MNKAFIFDMDGVIIDSETIWKKHEKKFFTELLGHAMYQKIKEHIFGSTTNTIYDLARQNGGSLERKLFLEKYDEQAKAVYTQSALTKNIDTLIEKLIALDFKLGLLSASRLLWIEQVVPKLKNRHAFSCILSLSDREDLRPKPSPDGYREVIKQLGSIPEKTIILEDSQKGVTAAKASGALTICLTEHLPKEYKSEGADVYVNNVKDIITFIETYE